VRHVRMLGLCLVAAVAMSAVATSSAFAVKNPTKNLKIFQNCPVHGVSEGGNPVVSCTFGATEVGEKGTAPGGHFTVGPITVPIEKQIILQYGLAENPLNEEVEEFVAPTHGVEAIIPVAEKVPGEPIANITEAEQNELGWPETLKYSYRTHKSQVKKVTETIEVAGKTATNATDLLIERGTAVEAPVKIKAGNQWMSELGVVCYVGSDEEPIVQHLTTGESESPSTHEIIHGHKGELSITLEGRFVTITHDALVDNTYPVPAAKCTGPYAEVIAATIDRKFGLPAVAGASSTEIDGTLYLASRELAELKGGAS
jgi:hypothetical protein